MITFDSLDVWLGKKENKLMSIQKKMFIKQFQKARKKYLKGVIRI